MDMMILSDRSLCLTQHISGLIFEDYGTRDKPTGGMIIYTVNEETSRAFLICTEVHDVRYGMRLSQILRTGRT